MDNLIKDRVLNEIIVLIFKDIDEIYKNDLIDGYKKYLSEAYSECDFSGQNDEIIYEFVLETEQERWANEDKNVILSSLVRDDAYSKIKIISAIAYKYAMERKKAIESGLDKEINKELAASKINEIKTLLEQVKPFNKSFAEELVGVSLLDFEFASGLSDFTSLRIGRINKR